MARKGKSSSRRRNKIEPSVMTLTFDLGTFEGTQKDYIDLSQVCSLVNRRFYRQGLNWAVAGFKLFTGTGFNGSFGISKLPNTWIMANSWEKGMRAWMKMNREALEESGSVRPRFLDFKVYAEHAHAVAGASANLIPISGGTPPVNAYTLGEWEMSKVYVPNALDLTQAPGVETLKDFELIATGGSYPGAGASGLDSVSLIEGYANSRSLPAITDPNAPDDAADTAGPTPENWLSAIFNEGETQSHEIIQDLLLENNQAPYPFENDGANLDTMYPGGANQGEGLEIHDSSNITATTIGGITRLKGGNFPCGLIHISSSNLGAASQVLLQIDMIPGTHRGYLAESMTEM